MNSDELEIRFLKLLQEFVDVKLKRRQKEPAFWLDRPDEFPPVPAPISPYAPMLRLLDGEDERFLRRYGLRRAAGEIRRCHRRCFLDYVTLLSRAARDVRRERIEAMQSNGTVNFDQILSKAIRIEMALLSLRWLSWKHRVRLSVSAADIAARLDVILGAWQSAQVAAL
jgi:hypothetical protein